MYYLEHCLREAGMTSADTVAILHTSEEPWIYGDLRAELLDVFPGAAVTVTAPDAVPPGTDLVVVPFTDPPAFPQQDVVRLHLRELDAWARRLPRDASVLLYRAAWREMEVVRPGRLRATARRKRREAAALRLLDRVPLLRRALRPLY